MQKHTWRYLATAVVFCLLCVTYLGRLFFIQIADRDPTYQTGTTTRTVTVQAARGKIYDRNGKVLVENRYTYDLVVVHESFSALSAKESNDVLLRLLDAMEAADESEKHVEKYFPFDGAYPYYGWSEEIADRDSIPYYRLMRVWKDLGIKEEITVERLVAYYVEEYGLLATDAEGNRIYDDDQIDRLLRMRYDMSALRFGAATDYTVAEDVGLGLIAHVKEQNLKGTTFLMNTERVYAYTGYASHILGQIGPIYSEEWEYYNEQGYPMNATVGKSGCEYAFESYLRGTDGKLRIEQDAAGNIVRVEVLQAPVAGNDVYLTIDIDLQIAAEDGLKENVQFVTDRSAGYAMYGAGCDAGAAVAMDPETFEVLAIASYPTYDLGTYNLMYNELAADPAQPLINRAINGAYAPGSTIKPGVTVAGMLAGEISQHSTIYCGGVYTRYEGYQPKCSTYGSSHRGSIRAQTAIAVSCNCFFYELGYRMGIDTMNQYLTALGFGEHTGLEIGGTEGILAGPLYRQESNGEEWQPGNTLQAAIGQSDHMASPMQLACYLSTISNGGTRYSAHLLHSVYAVGQSEPIYTYTVKPDSARAHLELSDEILATVFAGMREMVTSHATANRNLSTLPVAVGGKTGTAQTSEDCENALFICAAPYDAPEIVVSVVLEQGYSGEYASLTAARILERYYGVEK
ncbi:MAG: hypothetical protein IIX80_05110 [Clostridia bacterium]|nr:hypothetical protein [Clostridia bacterium]